MPDYSYEIIAFRLREGRVYRNDRIALTLGVLDNVPGELARRASSQVAMGRGVLVLEHGCIKPNFSRVDARYVHALVQMLEPDYVRLIAGVEGLRGMKQEEFAGHVKRSFPQYA